MSARALAFDFTHVLPGLAYSNTAHRGMELVDLKSLGILPGIIGGAGGTNTVGDLVTTTADGLDLNVLWNEFQAVNEEYNRQRQALVDFISYSVQNPVEEVPLVGTGGDFEEASEFGVPRSYRPEVDSFAMGFSFKWYDLANRFTWQFLSEAPAAQVRAIENIALEADSRLVFVKVMRQLFRNVTDRATIRNRPYNVFGFYNGGTDPDETPPTYRTRTFSPGHNHFMVSGSATVEAQDLEDLMENVTEHGYTRLEGYRLVVMCNRQEVNTIRNFRSRHSLGPDYPAGPLVGTYDFIPAQGSPGVILPDAVNVLGRGQVAPTLDGMNVVGSYGDLLIVEEDYIPAGYMVLFATGGRDNLQNPIGFREHQNPGLRGMRLVKGRNADYPLMDAYYIRGFGTGVRHRGAGAIMQIKATGTYEPPAQFA